MISRKSEPEKCSLHVIQLKKYSGKCALRPARAVLSGLGCVESSSGSSSTSYQFNNIGGWRELCKDRAYRVEASSGEVRRKRLHFLINTLIIGKYRSPYRSQVCKRYAVKICGQCFCPIDSHCHCPVQKLQELIVLSYRERNIQRNERI